MMRHKARITSSWWGDSLWILTEEYNTSICTKRQFLSFSHKFIYWYLIQLLSLSSIWWWVLFNVIHLGIDVKFIFFSFRCVDVVDMMMCLRGNLLDVLALYKFHNFFSYFKSLNINKIFQIIVLINESSLQLLSVWLYIQI